jgi:hypothetical protein
MAGRGKLLLYFTQHVNFQNSKVTRILQSSLGGNAHTAIICAVTPASVVGTASTLGIIQNFYIVD